MRKINLSAGRLSGSIKYLPGAVGGVCFFVMLLVFPSQAASGVSAGLSICASRVIPSLFPFTVLCELIVSTGCCRAMSRFASPVMNTAFRLPGAAFTAIVMGLIGGYPTGARAVYKLYAAGEVTKQQSFTLMLFCVNAGPAFVLGTVGSLLGADRGSCMLLFLSLCSASLLTGFFTRFLSSEPVQKPRKETGLCFNSAQPFSACLTDAVAQATSAMLSVCAYVMLFSCVCSLLDTSDISDSVLLTLKCILEVTTGCAQGASVHLSLPVFAFILGWSGLCVHCQVLKFVRECDMSYVVFAVSRLVNGASAAVICSTLLRFFPRDAVTFAAASGAHGESFAFSAPVSCFLMLMGALMILDTLPIFEMLGNDKSPRRSEGSCRMKKFFDL